MKNRETRIKSDMPKKVTFNGEQVNVFDLSPTLVLFTGDFEMSDIIR